MADLPSGVAEQMMVDTVGNIRELSQLNRGVTAAALGVLQGTIVRKHDELDTVESRAVSGVTATPIASPTTQAGQ